MRPVRAAAVKNIKNAADLRRSRNNLNDDPLQAMIQMIIIDLSLADMTSKTVFRKAVDGTFF